LCLRRNDKSGSWTHPAREIGSIGNQGQWKAGETIVPF
jgi:hypothetical protein